MGRCKNGAFFTSHFPKTDQNHRKMQSPLHFFRKVVMIDKAEIAWYYVNARNNSNWIRRRPVLDENEEA